MEWTAEDKNFLLSFKNSVDCDDVKVKEIVKKVLLQNKYIVHVLNDDELEAADAEPDDYFGRNILPYYIINPTQHNIKNFICYEVSYNSINRYNSIVKELNLVFYILCEQRNIRDDDTGIARHDLLAALIQDQFNYSNYFGSKITLISDTASVVDADYACRTLTFRQNTDNNVVKTRNGVSYIHNKDVVTLEES